MRSPAARVVAGVLLAVTCAGCGGADRTALPAGPYVPAPGAPVVIIGLDTCRGDHLHAAGNENIRTPHLDDLAADGVLFSRCQSTAPWTAPAFASILTGLTPWRHGYVGGQHLKLADEFTTVAEHLRDAGYRTGAFVTIDWLTTDFGMGQGFDDHTFLRTTGRKNGHLVTERGLAWLTAEAAAPALLFLHYFDVHAPYMPPPAFDRMYYEGSPWAPGEPIVDFLRSEGNKVLNKANKGKMYDWLEGVTDWDYPVQQYAAGVSAVDHQVGRVVAGLQAAGLYDDALIIVVGDHGEHLGEHDLWFTHALPWQEALHVPLVVKYPANQFAGRTVERRVSVLDVLPTVFGARGAPKPNGLDGRDLTEILTDPEGASPSLLLGGTGHRQDACWQTLVEDDWKLVVQWEGGSRREMLFDLARDPGELEDVAAKHPERVTGLLESLGRSIDLARPLTGRQPLGDDHLGEAARRKLRSLGYVH